MASGDTLCTFMAWEGFAPASNYGTKAVRASITPVIEFADGATSSIYYNGFMPRHYAAGGVTVTLGWMAKDTTVTPHNAVLTAAFKSVTDDADDLDSKTFAAANTVTDAEASASGEVAYAVITFTDGADMDSVAAGEYFQLEIGRLGGDGSDSLTDAVQLVFVEVKET